MATQVLSSKDQSEAVVTGVIPVPPEVAADNALRDGIKPETGKPQESKASGEADIPKGDAQDADDVEGEDGLTPRQKRELTKKMQASIGKKHRQLKEAEEFAAEQYNERRLAENRAAELERQLQRNKGVAEQPRIVNDGTDRPRAENFTSQEEYEKAVIDWRVNEILKEKDRDAAVKAEEARRKTVSDAAMERLARAREIVPDFQEITEAAEIPVPPHIGAVMMESELFPELGYYFAKHPEELQKLAEMPVQKALVAFGKIEAIIKPFETGLKPAAKSNGAKPSQNGSIPSTETVSPPSKPRAAAPITPLSTPSTAQADKPVNARNVREEIAAWNRERSGDILRRKRH